MSEVEKQEEKNSSFESQLNSVYEKILHKEYKDINTPLDNDIKVTTDQDIKQEASESANISKKEITDKVNKEKDKKVEEEEALENAPENIKYSDLEKQVNEAKKWGQQKNRQLVNTRRKISELVSKLNEDGVIPEENVQTILSSFNDIDDNIEDSKEQENVQNPFVVVKDKMDNEFKTFKRYNKSTNADAKYEAFYSFFPLMSEKAQEEAFNYLEDSEPDVALDYIMTNGTELYETIFKGAEEKGDILKYVKSLQTELEKIKKKSESLEGELDSTTKKVYNVGTDSKARTSVNKVSTAKDFYLQRYQS
tara:strand:+ start:3233 stop:4156 length:924 start_codon:yes stop_codon:yes gene_type:complete